MVTGGGGYDQDVSVVGIACLRNLGKYRPGAKFTMGLELVEGRDFIKDSETDKKESIIITQKMARVFGWDKPLGKEVVWRDTVKLYVTGVIKDVYTMGLWREMEPMMIRYILPDKYSQIVVSTRAEDVASINAFMN